jgi:hypothetical protein
MWETLAPAMVVSILIVTVGATIVLRGPLGKALAERIAGRSARDDSAVERLRGDVDQLHGVVGELEERLEFAERLLARQREADRLPGGA